MSSGSLDAPTILRAADAAVVGRSFREVPGLPAALARRFPVRTEIGGVAVYVRR